MSRSLSYLRRGLLGIALAGSLGFGATQAFAEPKAGPATGMRSCPVGYYMCSCPSGTSCTKHIKRCPC